MISRPDRMVCHFDGSLIIEFPADLPLGMVFPTHKVRVLTYPEETVKNGIRELSVYMNFDGVVIVRTVELVDDQGQPDAKMAVDNDGHLLESSFNYRLAGIRLRDERNER